MDWIQLTLIAFSLAAMVLSQLLGADMSCRMIFGKKYEDEDVDPKGFKGVISEALQLAAAPNLGDYFPYLGKLDLQGLTKKMQAISKVIDKFLERILEEHDEQLSAESQGKTKDFVDTLTDIMKSGEAEFEFDRRHVKAVVQEMFGGSWDTGAAVIDWTISELLKHPKVMKKVQKEREDKIGMNRIVEKSDLESLEYLDMVIKESMRLHPVVPLLLPHEAINDCIINGYHIPTKSRIIVNAHAIGRDPEAWCDPDEFIPERFIGSDIDVWGHDFQLIPFGSGRRGCPGMHLGMTVVRQVVAQLVHCFDWELPDGISVTELDMTEEFGLVVDRAKHLLVVPTYRLHI